MKIGIDIRTLMDPQYSGVSEYAHNLIKELLRLDRENEYKLFYNSLKDVSRNIPAFKEENCELVNTRYPNKIFNYLLQKSFNYPKIDRLIKSRSKSQEGIDLFFMPHINFISLSDDCRKIITIHDLSFLRYPEFFSGRKNIWHRAIKVKKLLNNFDLVAAVSENTKKDLIELIGLPEDKVRVIYSGLGREFRELDKKDERLKKTKEKYGLPDNFIFYLGTIEPRKNIDGLIKAYEVFMKKNPKFSDFELVLAGGRGWKSRGIYQTRQNSKLKEKIKFLGYVNKNDKVYLYNSAKVFVYPSFYEGFGFPPLEARACGTPVITSACSSLPEVMNGGALMVDPYNLGDIGLAIKTVLENYEFFKTANKRPEKFFSWEKCANEYIKLFNMFGK